jgi:hypothetical protein
MSRPDFVRVTHRRNHRGTTTSVECLACGVLQPLVVPGRRTPAQADLQRVIYLFGAMHDASCSDRVDSLVRSMMASAAPVEPPEAESIGYIETTPAEATEGQS